MQKLTLKIFIAAAFASAISFLGCAAQLAPQYDQAILDGLTEVNKSTQTFFASIGSGVDKATYSKRVDTYASLIGGLNALEIQSKSRPLPPSDYLSKINSTLTESGAVSIPADKNFSNYPSARAIHDASMSIQTMQHMDETSGLRGGQLESLKNQTSTYLSQAMTYETFLKR